MEVKALRIPTQEQSTFDLKSFLKKKPKTHWDHQLRSRIQDIILRQEEGLEELHWGVLFYRYGFAAHWKQAELAKAMRRSIGEIRTAEREGLALVNSILQKELPELFGIGSYDPPETLKAFLEDHSYHPDAQPIYAILQQQLHNLPERQADVISGWGGFEEERWTNNELADLWGVHWQQIARDKKHALKTLEELLERERPDLFKIPENMTTLPVSRSRITQSDDEVLKLKIPKATIEEAIENTPYTPPPEFVSVLETDGLYPAEVEAEETVNAAMHTFDKHLLEYIKKSNDDDTIVDLFDTINGKSVLELLIIEGDKDNGHEIDAAGVYHPKYAHPRLGKKIEIALGELTLDGYLMYMDAERLKAHLALAVGERRSDIDTAVDTYADVLTERGQKWPEGIDVIHAATTILKNAGAEDAIGMYHIQRQHAQQLADQAVKVFNLYNRRLVWSVAKNFSHPNIELFDLVNEGTIGLMRGAQKYDSRRKLRFSTYVVWWIRQGITRALADTGNNIRIPVHVHEKLGRIYKYWPSRRFGSDFEIACTKAGIKKKKIKELARYAVLDSGTMSLEFSDGEGSEFGDLLAIDKPGPYELTAAQGMSATLHKALAFLPKREQEIMRLRFGLVDEPRTLEAVGEMIGVTRERVRQLESKALKRLRTYAKNTTGSGAYLGSLQEYLG